MFNTGLEWFENRTLNDFTSDVGLVIRKKSNFVWRNLIRLFVGRKMYIEQYPKLEKGKPYIFVGNHSFDEDINLPSILYFFTLLSSTINK